MKKINENNALEKAKELLYIFEQEGPKTNLDFSDCIKKLQEVIKSEGDNDIKIVLLGRFSDGKTSTIAGMMEEVFENMIIDTDESSDQLVVYHPRDLKRGFTIIDTPGLFGTKEKEIDGENVKFSEITQKFISEAHIVMYVTSAQVPVKESHSGILRKVLRELNKLDSTIFVLNKMDETGVNITREDDYRDMCTIKKAFLIERLRNVIGLTAEEEKRLNVVCVCADPKGKGVQKWLETPERYRQLSRLTDLKNTLDNITNTANTDALKKQAYLASINDVIGQVSVIYKDVNKLERNFNQFKEDFTESETDLREVGTNLKKTKERMRTQIRSLRESVFRKIDNASFDEMDAVLTNDIGVQDDKVTFYIIEDKINGIIDSCSLNNESTLTPAWKDMKDKFEKEDSTFKDLAGKGLGMMKNVNAKNVLQARDLLFKSFKFKPWGATKLANGIGKAAIVIQVAMTAFDLYGKYKRNKQLKETKDSLKSSLNDYFADISNLMKDDETYYKNFAPSYIDMYDELELRRKKCEENDRQISNIKSFKDRINSIYGGNIEDAEFVEV